MPAFPSDGGCQCCGEGFDLVAATDVRFCEGCYKAGCPKSTINQPCKKKNVSEPKIDMSKSGIFIHSETLGWFCHCGAMENMPAILATLVGVDRPITVKSFWTGGTKTILLICNMCECSDCVVQEHSIIDITASRPSLLLGNA